MAISQSASVRPTRRLNLSQVFAGQNVGVREVADHIWLISFMHYDRWLPGTDCSRLCRESSAALRTAAAKRVGVQLGQGPSCREDVDFGSAGMICGRVLT